MLLRSESVTVYGVIVLCVGSLTTSYFSLSCTGDATK